MNDQFVLSTEPPAAPGDFVRHQGVGWHLAVSSTLPVTELRAAGTHIGWLLGWVITPDGLLAHESGSMAVPGLSAGDADVFEQHLFACSGRWTCLVLAGGSLRCYVDPGASLGTVYCEDRGMIASTTTMIRWGDFGTLSDARFAARTLRKNQFHPAGLTSDPGVRRVLPNHVLATASWRTSRHWPRHPLTRISESETVQAVSGIATRTAAILEALAERSWLLLPLTSGRDSRMVMSAARGLIDRSEFVTFDYRDFRKSDGRYARAVAKRFRLTHHLLPVEEADAADKRRYLEAVGYDGNEGKARDFLVAAERLPRDRGWITGFLGELGRGYYWHDEDASGTMPETRELLRRMRLDASEQNIRALEDWRATTDAVDVPQLLDLMYLENRQGCWASPQLYGAAPFDFSVIPLNSRSTVEAMLRLPEDYVRGGHLAPAVTEAGWPELAALPYDRRPGLVGQIQYGAHRARLNLGRFYRRVTHTTSR